MLRFIKLFRRLLETLSLNKKQNLRVKASKISSKKLTKNPVRCLIAYIKKKRLFSRTIRTKTIIEHKQWLILRAISTTRLGGEFTLFMRCTLPVVTITQCINCGNYPTHAQWCLKSTACSMFAIRRSYVAEPISVITSGRKWGHDSLHWSTRH